MRKVLILTCIAIGASVPLITLSNANAAYIAWDGFAYEVWNVSRRIHVCYHTAGFYTDKDWIRQAMESTWMSESAIQFVWDGDCSGPPSNGFDIDIVDTTGPSWSIIGPAASYSNPGMHLEDWNDAQFVATTPFPTRQDYVSDASVHEFAHLLGLLHEQRRPDYPYSCAADDGSGGGLVVPPGAAFDSNSVSYYCSPQLNYNGTRLTGADIAAIGDFYGASVPFALISTGSHTYDIFGRYNTYPGGQLAVRHIANGAYDSSVLNLGSLDGQISSGPTAVYSSATGQTNVFVRSQSGHLAQITRNCCNWSFWSNWVDLGGPPSTITIGATSPSGTFVGQPTAVLRSGNQITVLVRNGDNGLSVREFDGSIWSNWINISGDFTGVPNATVGQDGAINVFVAWRDKSLRTLRSTSLGSWPTDWTNLGGQILGSPSSSVLKNRGNLNDVWVFARGTDNAVYYQRMGRGTITWSGWQAAYGVITGNPVAVSRSNESMDVFVRDPSGGVWSTYYVGSGFANWFQLLSADGANAFNATIGTPIAAAAGGDWMQVFLLQDYQQQIRDLQWSATGGWVTTVIHDPNIGWY